MEASGVPPKFWNLSIKQRGVSSQNTLIKVDLLWGKTFSCYLYIYSQLLWKIWKNQLFTYPLAWRSPHYEDLQWTMRIRLWFSVTIFLRVFFLYFAMQILAVLVGAQNTLRCGMEACVILTWLNCEYDFRRCMTAAPLAFQSFVRLCFFTPSSLSCFLRILSFFRRDELSKERNITEGNELKV
jgi:hypothetical protein